MEAAGKVKYIGNECMFGIEKVRIKDCSDAFAAEDAETGIF